MYKKHMALHDPFSDFAGAWIFFSKCKQSLREDRLKHVPRFSQSNRHRNCLIYGIICSSRASELVRDKSFLFTFFQLFFVLHCILIDIRHWRAESKLRLAVQPFECVKSEHHRWMTWASRPIFLRGQFLYKMFAESKVIFMSILICGFSCKYSSILYYISCGF